MRRFCLPVVPGASSPVRVWRGPGSGRFFAILVLCLGLFGFCSRQEAHAAAPTITTATSLSAGTVGVAYNQILTATGGVTPYAWTVDSGSLPAGLVLSNNGLISGTATVAGTYSFTIRVTGSDTLFFPNSFSLTVAENSYSWANFVGFPLASGTANGTGSVARFSFPDGVAIDGLGNIYVADYYNHTIRKVTSSGVVTTLAGSPGVSGSTNGTGGAAKFMDLPTWRWTARAMSTWQTARTIPSGK